MPSQIAQSHHSQRMAELMRDFVNRYGSLTYTLVLDAFGILFSNKLSASFTYEESKSYSDVTIICGNDTYYAHRLVIFPQSPFFRNACKPTFKVSYLLRTDINRMLKSAGKVSKPRSTYQKKTQRRSDW